MVSSHHEGVTCTWSEQVCNMLRTALIAVMALLVRSTSFTLFSFSLLALVFRPFYGVFGFSKGAALVVLAHYYMALVPLMYWHYY